MKTGPKPRPITERFWTKVTKTEGCWLWTKATARTGYGLLSRGSNQTPWQTHRLSWVLHYGPIPTGLCVLHSCDTPGCVRPDHLFLGTRGDNIHDAIAKGRANLARYNYGPANGRWQGGRSQAYQRRIKRQAS